MLTAISASYAGLFDTITVNSTITTADDFSQFVKKGQNAWARMNDHPKDFTYKFIEHGWSNTQNWATYLINQIEEETVFTYFIYSEEHSRVGEMYLIRDNHYLNIKYHFDEGVAIKQSHLHIATKLEQIPQKGGIPQPQRFDYNNYYNASSNQFSFHVRWDQSWNDNPLYIAASFIIIDLN